MFTGSRNPKADICGASLLPPTGTPKQIWRTYDSTSETTLQGGVLQLYYLEMLLPQACVVWGLDCCHWQGVEKQHSHVDALKHGTIQKKHLIPNDIIMYSWLHRICGQATWVVTLGDTRKPRSKLWTSRLG